MSKNEKRKWCDPEQIQEEYQRGITYKTGLSEIGMYEQNRINQRFYIGDQWHGAQCGDQRPLTRYNIIKRIGDFKMAMVAGGPVAALYTAEGIPLTSATVERVRERKKLYREAAAQIPEATSEEEIHLAMAAMSDYFKTTAERVKFDDLKNLVLRQAYVTGTGILYTYWDESVPTGQFADDGKNSPIKGDIQSEVLDIENVYYGDSAESDIQKQPSIIIAQRCRVEDVRREARRNQRPQNELEAIQPDKETEHTAGRVNGNEPDGEEKITVLTKLCKVYDKDTDAYTIHAVRVVKGATIRKEWDTKLRRYPLAKMDWERERGCAYGVSEVTYLVPNQISINQAQTAAGHAVSMIGLPIQLVNMDVVTTPVTNDPGQIIPVYGAEDMDRVIKYVVPPNFSAQFDNLVNSMMVNTMASTGANDAALGDMRPDNTSAFLAAREAATVPLQLLQNRFYSFVEDVARNWAEYWVNWYGVRRLKVEEDGDVYYIPFEGKKYRDVLINVRVDVGPSTLWSEIQERQILADLLAAGHITLKQYLERLPKGTIPNQTGLLQELKRAEQLTPPEDPLPEAGDGVAETLSKLSEEYKQKMAGMSPEQQAALAQEMAAQM